MEQQKEKEAFRKYQELKGLQQQEERWRLATPERKKHAKPK